MKSFNELKKRNKLSSFDMSKIKGGSLTPVGTCGYISSDGDVECNISREYALFMHEWAGGYWCCDSCSQTSYCGPYMQ